MDVTIPTAATRNVRSRLGAWAGRKEEAKKHTFEFAEKGYVLFCARHSLFKTTFCAGRNRKKGLRRKGLQEGKKERWGAAGGKSKRALRVVVLATVLYSRADGTLVEERKKRCVALGVDKINTQFNVYFVPISKTKLFYGARAMK